MTWELQFFFGSDCKFLETLLSSKQIVISAWFFACLASLIYNGTWNSPKIWRQLVLWPSTTTPSSSMMWQCCPLLYSHKSSYSSFVQFLNWSAMARQHCGNSSHPSTTLPATGYTTVLHWWYYIMKYQHFQTVNEPLFCVKTGDGSIYISI